jgi:uncharacterized protein
MSYQDIPALLIFTKAPIAGQVKTRLIPALNAEAAATLHVNLLNHTLQRVHNIGWPIQLWCAPDTHHPLFSAYQQQYSLTLQQQVGKDLGARMQYAFSAAFKHAAKVIIIGSDCPEIDQDYLYQAHQTLSTNAPIVLGPAIDGGYVLIGLYRMPPMQLQKTFSALFDNMPWSQTHLLTVTLQQLQAIHTQHLCLNMLRDIDNAADLSWLQQHFPALAVPAIAEGLN